MRALHRLATGVLRARGIGQLGDIVARIKCASVLHGSPMLFTENEELGTENFLGRRFMFRFKTILPLALLCLTPMLWGQTRTSDKDRHADPPWRMRLNELLPLMGHRNWIAVVDSAYPLQTSEGIETIETDGDQLDVVRRVVREVAETKHVRPLVFTDTELRAVPEDDAPGVTYYRDQLNHFLSEFDAGSLERQSLPHEQIISKLDEAGKTFHILVLKTRMTIPYTSVFLRLDCGYWTEEQEKRLRERMGK